MVSAETLRLQRERKSKGAFGSTPRFSGAATSSTPGPGGYNSSDAYQKTVKKGGSGVSLGKSSRFENRPKSAQSPGPGQYSGPALESSFVGTPVKGGGSSTFRSSTPRLGEARSAVPGPGQYDVEQATPKKESKRTGKRFDDYVTPSPGPAAYNSDAPLQRPGSASSVFRSSTPRLPEHKSEAPGVGAYDNAHLSIDQSLKNVSQGQLGKTSAMGSSDRFEKYVTPSPGPAAYELKEDQKKGFTPMKSTSERFGPSDTVAPGPGQYDVEQATPKKESKRTGKRFDDYVTPSPGPAAYDVEEKKQATAPSTAFKSTVERFPDASTNVPGPAAYMAEAALNASTQGGVFAEGSAIAGPSPMASKAPRFEEVKKVGPAPHDHYNERALDIIYSPTIR